MTTIFNIVDSAAQLPQREEPRQSTKDFANELAKQEPQAKPPAQSQAKTVPDGEFDGSQPFQSKEPNIASAMNEMPPEAPIQATTLQQLQAAEPAIVAPIGVTETLLEARVFGWHAMAQAYLSELTAANGGVKPLPAGPVHQAALTAPAGPVEVLPTVATDIAVPEAASEVRSIQTLAIQPSFDTDETAPASTMQATVAGSSAQALWAERSLRFTRQRDGSSVAWLRDFRLDDAEASHLVKWILADARQKGVALSRVMLNGREVWVSSNLDMRNTP